MKKFLLMLVICVSSFMIYTNNVSASANSKFLSIDTAVSGWGYSHNISGWGNTKDGYVTFSFILFYNPGGSTPTLSNVYLVNENGSAYACNIGNMSSYIDSQYSLNVYSATCRYNSDNTQLSYIRFSFPQQVPSGIVNLYSYGPISLFVEETPSYESILNSINTNVVGVQNRLNVVDNSIQTLITNTNALKTSIENYLSTISNSLSNVNTNTQQINNNTNEIKNDIKSDNVNGAEGSADDLKNNSAFQDNSGLSGVISMPLTFINSLTNSCQAITLTIPYMDEELTIPCLQPIITNKMPLLANLIKIVINGFIVYRVLLDIFQIVRNAKNPEDDRIEVLDL